MIAPWVTLPELARQLGWCLVTLVRRLEEAGWADSQARPSAAAKREELVQWRQAYRWHGPRLAQALGATLGPASGSTPAVGVASADPDWGSMEAVGVAFGWTARQAGERLRQAGWRDANGLPTPEALSLGLVKAQALRGGWTVAYRWHLALTNQALVAKGHAHVGNFEQQVLATRRALVRAKRARPGRWDEPYRAVLEPVLAVPAHDRLKVVNQVLKSLPRASKARAALGQAMAHQPCGSPLSLEALDAQQRVESLDDRWDRPVPRSSRPPRL